jgi:succinate-semialdehyde dehydrogenase/glutarate-semialdehyde dehydrogenase
MHTIDPTTGEAMGEYVETTDAEVELRLAAAQSAFLRWRFTDLGERAKTLHRVAAALRATRDENAELMTREMGKPIGGARAEIDKCAECAIYYAENLERFLESELVETEASQSYVAYRPLGLVLGIMPWNFPFWQVFRFAIPALAAGNAVILKHAPSVPGCANALEELFHDAGLPDGLFTSLLIDVGKVGDLIDDPRVASVSLTGSSRAGRAVAKRAASTLTKTVLELGGSDAYIVLEDANLELAIETCVASRLINSGQSCIAAKRFIVVDEVRKRFEEGFVARMEKATMGQPLDPSTHVGPLARGDLRDALHDQVRASIAAGARPALGAELPYEPGFWYPPTVLVNVTPGMAVFDEETFGPVAAIVPARDEAEAIELANRSVFGLGAAVFTEDVERGRSIAELELEAGSCFVNAFVRSDPRLPFGGIKQSGWGRELSLHGLREFCNVKTVYVG